MDRQKMKSFSEVNKWIRKEGSNFRQGETHIQRNNGVMKILGDVW